MSGYTGVPVLQEKSSIWCLMWLLWLHIKTVIRGRDGKGPDADDDAGVVMFTHSQTGVILQALQCVRPCWTPCLLTIIMFGGWMRYLNNEKRKFQYTQLGLSLAVISLRCFLNHVFLKENFFFITTLTFIACVVGSICCNIVLTQSNCWDLLAQQYCWK